MKCRALHWMRGECELTDLFEIRADMQPVHFLSPLLISLTIHWIVKTTVASTRNGIQRPLRGRGDLNFADISLLSATQNSMQDKLNTPHRTSQQLGLNIHGGKKDIEHKSKKKKNYNNQSAIEKSHFQRGNIAHI